MKKNSNNLPINHKDISIFSYGRKNSQRCHNKLLRKFHDTSVVDILLNKIGQYENCYFGGYDKEFKYKCKNHGVNFLQRTKRSVNIDYPISDALSFVKEIDSKYLLLVNSCLPFLSVETINLFLSEVIKSNFKPTSLLFKRDNYFFNKNFKPLNFDTNLKTLNTKTVKPIYEFANALYFFKKDYFLKYNKYWNWNSVNYVTIDNKIELLDIDTEDDFIISESLWKNIYA
tara:strand:+ start:101 stop:787 length:687 start_codon:yes stop_codon:yes gene_type:complete